MKFSTTITVLLVILGSARALNILGIFPYHGKSHFLVFKVYLRELVNRGHNLTIISHFPEENPPKNYNDIALAGNFTPMPSDMPFESSYRMLFKIVELLLSFGTENCEVMLANAQVQELVKQKAKFDVVVLEQFNSDCSLGVAYKLGAPVVATESAVLMPWHYQRHGIPYNPSYVPFHFLEGGTKPTLYQRIERSVLDISFRSYYYWMAQRKDQRTLAKYFDDIPPLEDLAREIKFLLLYQNLILTGSRLFPANVIEVGGYHVLDAKPLKGDLKKFVDEAEHGIIYISFGSLLTSSTLPEPLLHGIQAAVKEFPQRLIWKWDTKMLIADKNKLYVDDWLPQVDILGHPKTLAFISHAGLGGTTEAMHYGVPMVAIPIIGDQPSNAAAIAECGLGVMILPKDLTKEILGNALNKVLRPAFRERAKSLSKAWHDRPMSPLDTAVYWTEFAARHANLTFRTAAADVPTYQYINLDIICVFVLISLLSVIIVKMLCSVAKLIKGKGKSKRE